MRTRLFKIGASIGLLGVVLGAFGAHALRPTLEGNQTLESYKTAVLYQFVHSILIIVIANSPYHSERSSRTISYLAFLGILFFSGSLYLLSTMQWSWLGPVTPVGGLLFMAAWITSILTAKDQD